MKRRKFIFGDEWLYIKVYSGPQALELILFSDLRPILETLYSSNIITKFYFVRYYDEEGYHIRLRFKLLNNEFFPTVTQKLNRFLREYIEDRVIEKVSIETYNREIERYGSILIDDIETLFSVNSWEIITLLSEKTDFEEKLIIGCKIIDALLNEFQISAHDKYRLYQDYYEDYLNEFGFSSVSLDELKKKYRTFGKRLHKIMIEDIYLPEIPNTQLKDFDKKKYAINIIKSHYENDISDTKYKTLLRDIIHMHNNRIFRVKHRENELVLYYILSNLYKSMSILELKKFSNS